MNPYTDLAKSAVETFIKDKKVISPLKNLPKEFLSKKAGVFVTLEKQEQLRGCIGTYLPTKKNIAGEIISNAIAAATQDYRFTPIQKKELVELSYTVYILNRPELVLELNPVKWASPKIRRILFDRVNPKKYGIIVKTITPPLKSGLLLPDLEGIDTIEEQISITCQKGEINPETEKILIYKFTVQKHQ